MRLNKLFVAMAVGVMSTTLFSSCLKDDDDVFNESSAERLQATLDKCKSVLTSSEYGWAFDYYPDRHLTSGGYVFTCKFTGNEVTAGFELEQGVFETSYYKMTNDNGPILSFDTYNSLLHYFATPSSGEYEAKDGDFEFMIMDVQDDVIKLRGNRNGNYAYLHRLDRDAETYLNDVAAASSSIFHKELVGKIGGTEVEISMEPARGSRYFEASWGEDDAFGSVFVPTTNGIRFMEPITVNGVSVSELEYKVTEFRYVGVDSKGNEIALQGERPADYSEYDEYIGNFSMRYSTNGQRGVDVSIEANGEHSYLIKGLGNSFDVVATYNEARGCMQLTSQQVGVDGTDLYWLCAVGTDADTGKAKPSWSTDCGFLIKKDPANPGKFLVSPNDYNQMQAHSLMVWRFAGSVDEDGYTNGGQAKDPWRLSTKSAQMANVNSFIKN